MFKENLNTRQLEQIVEALGKIAPQNRHKDYQGPDTDTGMTAVLLDNLFWGVYEGCTLGWDSITFSTIYSQGLTFQACERRRTYHANLGEDKQMQFGGSDNAVLRIYVKLAEDEDVFKYFGMV